MSHMIFKVLIENFRRYHLKKSKKKCFCKRVFANNQLPNNVFEQKLFLMFTLHTVTAIYPPDRRLRLGRNVNGRGKTVTLTRGSNTLFQHL